MQSGHADVNETKKTSAFLEKLGNLIIEPRVPPIVRFAGPPLFVGAALAIQIWLQTLVAGRTFLFLYPAIFISSMVAGFGPGLIATGIATVGAWYILEPFPFFKIGSEADAFGLFVFAFAGILFSCFGGLLRRSLIAERDQRIRLDDSIEKLRLANLDLNTQEHERTRSLLAASAAEA